MPRHARHFTAYSSTFICTGLLLLINTYSPTTALCNKHCLLVSPPNHQFQILVKITNIRDTLIQKCSFSPVTILNSIETTPTDPLSKESPQPITHRSRQPLSPGPQGISKQLATYLYTHSRAEDPRADGERNDIAESLGRAASSQIELRRTTRAHLQRYIICACAGAAASVALCEQARADPFIRYIACQGARRGPRGHLREL